MAFTARDVAKKAGVSLATVSRYFSGGKVVSTELARKIEDAADQLGYKHKGRRHRNCGVIAVLIPEFPLEFFSEVMREIVDQMPRYDYRVVFIPIFEGKDDYKQYFNEMNIEGVIYLDENISEDILNYIASKNIRTVMCGGATLDRRLGMVHINDLAAGYEGTRYLLGLGHEKLLFLSDRNRSISSVFQRLTGAKRAMEEKNIPFDESSMVLFGSVTYDMGYRLAKQAVESGREFTAIFAFSDEMAVGAMAALKACGVDVPKDVSVLGFDDITAAGRAVPPLTTIHQPIRQFVTKSLNMFLNLYGEEENMDITLPFDIVQRNTCQKRQ